MTTESKDDFILLPLSLPDDAPQILRLHHQVYLTDPLHSHPTEDPLSESEYIRQQTTYVLSRFKNPSLLAAKIIPSTSPTSSPPPLLVAYIVWNPPGQPDLRKQEEKDKAITEIVEKMEIKAEDEKKRMLELKKGDGVLSEKLLGKGYEGRYWELDALVVDEKHQRKGLGTRLVQWGLEKVKEDAKIRKGRRGVGDEGEEVVGAYLIASPQGARTYEKAGFDKIGERTTIGGNGEGYTHSWFAKRFD